MEREGPPVLAKALTHVLHCFWAPPRSSQSERTHPYLEEAGGGGEAGGASRPGDGLEHGQRSPHLPSPQEPHSLQWREAGVGLTLLLASSRPLLLLSFSTKRGSTGDALETEAQNGVSLRVGHPVCGHAALGPKSKLAGQMAPRGRPEAPEDGQGWWGGPSAPGPLLGHSPGSPQLRRPHPTTSLLPPPLGVTGQGAGPPLHPPGRSVAPRTVVLTSRPSGVAASKVSAWHGSTEGERPGHGDGPEGCWPHQGLEKYKGTDARGLSAQGGRGDASGTGSDTISPRLLGHPAGVCEQEGAHAAVSGDGPFGGHRLRGRPIPLRV